MNCPDITKYSDIISSDELKEFIEYWKIEEDLTNEERELFDEAKRLLKEYRELFDEAKRLLNEYGDDFVIIRYSYIEEYEEELVRECYSIPESLNWLFYHIDWEGVVRDLTMGGDLSEEEFCGIKYYVEMR